MLREPSRLTRLLALLACLPLPATSAGADEIPIDEFSGTPALGVYADLDANGLGQILPFASTLAVPITGTGTLLLPYDDFTDASAFASVNGLRLVFTAGSGFAFAADDLRSVPEPATAAMLGLGLLGMAFAGRRRERTAAPGQPAADSAR